MSINQPAWKPSKKLYQYARSLPYVKGADNVDYCMQVEGSTLIVAFQESKGVEDWKDNFDFFQELLDADAFDAYPSSKIKSHRGIARQYKAIRSIIHSFLYSGKIKRILIVGFSLGGALTIKATYDIGFRIDRDELKDVTVLGIAFNPPRVFNWSRIIKKAVKDRLITVVGWWDLVCHVPFVIMPTFFSFRWKPLKFRFCKPRLTFWRHYGQKIKIGKPWRLWPIQHDPLQVERALEEKFGE